MANPRFLLPQAVSGDTPWISLLAGAAMDIANSVAIDASGNTYIAGIKYATGNTASTADGIVAKFNSSGTCLWQKSIETASVYDIANSIVIDSSGNVYVAGQSALDTTAYTFIFKFNPTNGAIIWQRKYDTGLKTDGGVSIAINSVNELYVLSAITSTYNYGVILKYNVNGTLLNQYQLSTPSNHLDVKTIKIDVNKDIYVGASVSTTTGKIIKISYTTGLISWGVGFYHGAGFILKDVCASLNGNIYVIAAIATQSYLAKIDSSNGSILWKKNVPLGGNSGAVDISGDIYLCGGSGLSSISSLGVFKWANTLGTNSYNYSSIAVNSSFMLFVTGTTSFPTTASSDIISAKLPADGTIPLTGSYLVGSSTIAYTAETAITLSDNTTVSEGIDPSTALSELNPNFFAISYTTTGGSVSSQTIDIALTPTGVVVAGKGTSSSGLSTMFAVSVTSAGVMSDIKYSVTARTDTEGRGVACAPNGTVFLAGKGGGASAADAAVIRTSSAVMSISGTGLDTATAVVYNPATTGVYAMGFITAFAALFITSAPASLGSRNWTTYLARSGGGLIAKKLYVDSGNNPIAFITPSNLVNAIIKFSTAGAITWQLQSSNITCICPIPNTTNILVGFSGIAKAGTNSTFAVLAKLNSSGTIILSKYIYINTSTSSSISSICVNPTSGNIFIVINGGHVLTLDSSFTILRKVGIDAGDIVCDSSNNLYTAKVGTVSGIQQVKIIKYPQTGAGISGTFSDTTGGLTTTVVAFTNDYVTLDADVTAYIAAGTFTTTTTTSTWGAMSMLTDSTVLVSKTAPFGSLDAAGSLASNTTSLTPSSKTLV
jgi:hypothetical protein